MNLEPAAMYSKGNTDVVVCTNCGGKGHTKERCWGIIGYPKWHPKYKVQQRFQGKESAGNKWTKPKFGGGGPKLAANVQTENGSQNNLLTQQQIDQLLKLLPSGSGSKQGSETEDEMDGTFAGMVFSYCAYASVDKWIIDSEATDHMICDGNMLTTVRETRNQPKMNLPTGKCATITHIGNVQLNCGVNLRDVLCVPDFRHNLLSVQKLVKDEKCKVTFYPDVCVIQDSATLTVRAVGKAENGLYYLVNLPVNEPEKRQEKKLEEKVQLMLQKKKNFVLRWQKLVQIL
jgi:hypothetical protein